VIVGDAPASDGAGAIIRGDSARSIQSGGLTRTFLLHVPPSYDGSADVPLVLAFHGHGGTGRGQALVTHMSDVADANGFIAAYPNGVDHGWNDGRRRLSDARPPVDDVGFTADLITHLAADHRIDPSRVYATGFSQGGFMCFRLARDLPDLIAAIAPVSGLLSQDLADGFSSTVPVSMLMVMGTGDPLVAYGGRDAASPRGQKWGALLSAPDTARFFVRLNGCSPAGSTMTLHGAAPADDIITERTVWTGGRQGTEVRLYTVNGGGHTWPGGRRYSAMRVTGPLAKDFDASAAIWEFFAAHPRGG
jgi:polyhydroxybutyrate depolymerase